MESEGEDVDDDGKMILKRIEWENDRENADDSKEEE